ncbi:unnamed protein product [Rotaria socialis]
MPTASQSRILSVVDNQLRRQQAQQQQSSGGSPDTTVANVAGLISLNKTSAIESKRQKSKDDRRSSSGKRDNDDNNPPSPSNLNVRRRSSVKNGNGTPTPRSSQRTDFLQIPTSRLNPMIHNEAATSIHDVNQLETESKYKQIKAYSTQVTLAEENNSSSTSDLEYQNNNDEENTNIEQRNSLLNEYARRLFILGTIRPSKTFYKDLSEDDVEHLMEYFRRMRKSNRKLTSEEINQELQTKFIEYKPKIFFDSSVVTKTQVINIERILEQYADKVRAHQAELVKLDNPIRFVIKQIDNDTLLTTIPREYNDCFLTLITRTDPLRKSELIIELVQDKLLEDIKANVLDISYFPGGVNYDMPHDEINENGQMKLETYQNLKKRLNHRKIWYFDGPPEKKPNALLAILPIDSSVNMNHQRLLDCLYDQLKVVSINENFDRKDQILSIEFIPLSCILNSNDIQNQFIIDCDTIQTKEKLMEKPLKISLNKHLITIELRSYDEEIHKEYEKSIKAEKYRELIKNHDEAIKRKSSTK